MDGLRLVKEENGHKEPTRWKKVIPLSAVGLLAVGWLLSQVVRLCL